MYDISLKIRPPLYLIGKTILCWRCEAKMPAVALLAPHVADTEGNTCVLSDIYELPNEVLLFIKKRVPTFKLKYSKTVGQKYYANTCPKCGVLSGDFFLHSEPGAPFFPIDNKAANTLYMTEIPLSHPVTVKASINMGTGDLILKHAKTI